MTPTSRRIRLTDQAGNLRAEAMIDVGVTDGPLPEVVLHLGYPFVRTAPNTIIYRPARWAATTGEAARRA